MFTPTFAVLGAGGGCVVCGGGAGAGHAEVLFAVRLVGADRTHLAHSLRHLVKMAGGAALCTTRSEVTNPYSHSTTFPLTPCDSFPRYGERSRHVWTD